MIDGKEDLQAEGAAAARGACDNSPTICRGTHIPEALARLTVPPDARRSMNRCNLPAEALASLAFQLAPVALELDGVLPLHRPLFERLDALAGPAERAECFQRYVCAHFLLDDAGAQGLTDHARIDRSRLDYLRLLRGWLFDSESREGAVLKGWVESRFGLLTHYHHAPLGAPDSAARAVFEHELAAGLYGTGALEAQIDLLYAFAQYELPRRHPQQRHLTLYRGVRGKNGMTQVARLPGGEPVLQLNSLSSFSANRERAEEFGDRVVACEIPLAKILAFSHLLPGRLQGEDEYLVIGGVVAGRWLGM